jgi:hypothetical protein
MPLGKLEPVPLRELWSNEALDFTPWLANNLEFLGEKIGLALSLVERDASAGSFSADILAEDSGGNMVIVENQLEPTDHDHLGKLVTYLSNLDAKVAIWVTEGPRPEHEQAVHWLNEVVPADVAFYLVKIEAYRIGDSPAAPLFSLVAGPSVEARQAGAQKKELAERHALRQEYWVQLLDRAQKKTLLHARRSPTTDSWLNAGSGFSGVAFQYRIRMEDAQVGLRIRRDTEKESRQIFDAIYANKDDVERIFGKKLDWQPQEGLKMSIIQYVIPDGGLRDKGRWPQIQDAMVDAMVCLEKALKPQIQKLR